MATEIKSISISREFAQLAEEHHISWSEAARIGMAVILGDKGVREYDNQLNLFRKMKSIQNNMQETIDSLNRELENLNSRCQT